MSTAAPTPSIEDLKKLEEELDSEIRFRALRHWASLLVGALLVALSVFHYYTAGFGLLRETDHRGIHLAFVLGLIFLVFGWRRHRSGDVPRGGLLAPGGIGLIDWALAGAGVAASLYVPYIFDDLAFRVGNPLTIDVIMGTTLILVLLEATRRAIGWPLPVIALCMMAYAYFGPSMPGILIHPGNTWSGIVNHLYLTSQGIYGIALGVVATYVFHYVLFGVLATRIGLGKLFIDLASCLTGTYAGGPAKIAIFGSALFGMISGSSIANTVTVGSLTIPAMIRLGYQRHFAAAVESTASTGGQITPPIMGAAAFLMVEFLNLPYQTIVIAAIVPAAMHFLGVFMQVHFEAKRDGLRGMDPKDLPNPIDVLREGWQSVMPLIVLLVVLFSGFTPYLAAFWGITACIVVGVVRSPIATIGFFVVLISSVFTGTLTTDIVSIGLVGATFALSLLRYLTTEDGKLAVAAVVDAFIVGAKYAIGVGAAAATVGIIVGVVTLTGVGFKISFIVTSFAAQLGEFAVALVPFQLLDPRTATLFFTLLMTGIVCILLGCGVPTTANYIIMVTVAAPALTLLGTPPLVAHFFVFYYGVLADVTPPVALAAYAAASMAGADPFKTGNTAFRLALGKVMVPFVFAFAPSMLIMAPGFTLQEFVIATTGCIIGIIFLSAAFAGYMFSPLRTWERWLLGLAALPTVAPPLIALAIGLAMATPVIVRQLAARRLAAASG